MNSGTGESKIKEKFQFPMFDMVYAKGAKM
jgi:hypothetical protein